MRTNTAAHSNKGTALSRTLQALIRGKNSHTHCNRKAVSFITANGLAGSREQMKPPQITQLQN
jgi:hypothetical protein